MPVCLTEPLTHLCSVTHGGCLTCACPSWQLPASPQPCLPLRPVPYALYHMPAVFNANCCVCLLPRAHLYVPVRFGLRHPASNCRWRVPCAYLVSSFGTQRQTTRCKLPPGQCHDFGFTGSGLAAHCQTGGGCGTVWLVCQVRAVTAFHKSCRPAQQKWQTSLAMGLAAVAPMFVWDVENPGPTGSGIATPPFTSHRSSWSAASRISFLLCTRSSSSSPSCARCCTTRRHTEWCCVFHACHAPRHPAGIASVGMKTAETGRGTAKGPGAKRGRMAGTADT